ENAVREPGERENLPSVSVTGKLHRETWFLGHRQSMGRMREQNACAFSFNTGIFQNRPELAGICRLPKIYAHHLQTIDQHFLVLENAHTGFANRIQIPGAVPEFLVIAGNEVRAPWRRTVCPRFSETGSIHFRSVV